MSKRSNEPFLWMLFSAGGVVAAMLIPIHLFLFGVAFPLGWLDGPSYANLLALVSHPLARLYLFVLCALPLFHWAHRFRYTLRRFADQASQRTHQHLLLWRSDPRNGSGGLAPMADPLEQDSSDMYDLSFLRSGVLGASGRSASIGSPPAGVHGRARDAS